MSEVTKSRFKQVIQCGDSEIMYFLNDGWEILASAPNPYPQPYIFWFVWKFVDKKLSQEEVRNLISQAVPSYE